MINNRKAIAGHAQYFCHEFGGANEITSRGLLVRTLISKIENTAIEWKIEETTIDFDLYTSDSSFLWSRQRFCY